VTTHALSFSGTVPTTSTGRALFPQSRASLFRTSPEFGAVLPLKQQKTPFENLDALETTPYLDHG
jgi:hypothetical protein